MGFFRNKAEVFGNSQGKFVDRAASKHWNQIDTVDIVDILEENCCCFWYEH